MATPLENISQTTTGKTPEAEVMMLVHQRVPVCALIRTSKAHGHIAEMKSVRGARNMSDLTSMTPAQRYAQQKVGKISEPPGKASQSGSDA